MDALRRQRGYSVAIESTLNLTHPTTDLTVLGIVDISNDKSYTFQHRLFSDQELYAVLEDAVRSHNPQFTLNTVPHEERQLVLLKAQARVYRTLAGDTVRRRGMNADSSALVGLARDCDAEYEEISKKLSRIIVPQKANEDFVGPGDIMEGRIVKRSLRAGYLAPFRTTNPPTNPELYQPGDDDVEDTLVRLTWSPARDIRYSHYELWRDTQPNVERSLNGRLTQVSIGLANLPTQSQYSRASSSRQVFGVSFGHVITTPTFDGFYFGTAAEQPGSVLSNTTFIDGIVYAFQAQGAQAVLGEPIEPDGEYFYRLYMIDMNGEVMPSNIVRVMTKSIRGRLARRADKTIDATLALSPTQGAMAGGTAMTIRGTNFTAGTKVLIGGKECGSVVVVDTTTITCTSPVFRNPDFVGKQQDLALVTRNGLKDLYMRCWTVTA